MHSCCGSATVSTPHPTYTYQTRSDTNTHLFLLPDPHVHVPSRSHAPVPGPAPRSPCLSRSRLSPPVIPVARLTSPVPLYVLLQPATIQDVSMVGMTQQWTRILVWGLSNPLTRPNGRQ
ncbi:hypothetical protein FIBSPDRAFT_101943 [Athelia psychrophila]|uniref:Uncharacterized protein n=1 Tax=Athelia psychrophila TaxID=1759441 RepID=A0A166DHB9_9AGAM|nr:hypothetical protein FIBSPDRAFT_101943 [Fibularhizoctonia sp. CBS 109695]